MIRPAGFHLLRWCVYALLSSYGVVLFCFALEMIAGSFSRSMDRLLDRAMFAPTFAIPILCGLLSGYRFGMHLSKIQARLVFLLPLLAAAYEVSVWFHDTYPGQNLRASIEDNFLTTNCSGSECLEQVVVTAPLFASLAFTVGSEVRRLMQVRKPVPSK